MKKAISFLLVAIMLISCSVVAFAEQGGTKFIKNNDSYLLTEDGRLYRTSGGNIHLFETLHCIIDVVNLFQIYVMLAGISYDT